jgi:hypothetical protein
MLLIDFPDQSGCQRGASRCQHAQGFQVVALNHGLLGQVKNNWWSNVSMGNGMFLRDATESIELVFFHVGGRSPQPNGQMHQADEAYFHSHQLGT